MQMQPVSAGMQRPLANDQQTTLATLATLALHHIADIAGKRLTLTVIVWNRDTEDTLSG